MFPISEVEKIHRMAREDYEKRFRDLELKDQLVEISGRLRDVADRLCLNTPLIGYANPGLVYFLHWHCAMAKDHVDVLVRDGVDGVSG